MGIPAPPTGEEVIVEMLEYLDKLIKAVKGERSEFDHEDDSLSVTRAYTDGKLYQVKWIKKHMEVKYENCYSK